MICTGVDGGDIAISQRYQIEVWPVKGSQQSHYLVYQTNDCVLAIAYVWWLQVLIAFFLPTFTPQIPKLYPGKDNKGNKNERSIWIVYLDLTFLSHVV